MEKLHYEIIIDAPKEKVWNAMLEDKTYRQWTEVFSPGSYFEGNWEQGADIKFLGPNDKGTTDGMVSRIKTNRPYEYISIQHLGIIHDGKEDTSSEEAKPWGDTYENYTFVETDGKTQLLVDLEAKEMDPNMKEMFEGMWPKALQKLKEIAEA